MSDCKIRQIFEHFYKSFSTQGHFQSDVQQKVALAILKCKSGRLGTNITHCPDCGHIQYHHNSCRNRNCQAVKKEL